MSEQDASPTKEPDAERQPSEVVTFWTAQIKAYDEEFDAWSNKCKKIIRRYRDERNTREDGTVAGARFNALWSNVQTLQPAIYIKAPKPVVDRRFLDKDPLARVASMTLERASEVQLDVGKFHRSMKRATLDYLLCGRGTLWNRYEPVYGEPLDLGDGPQDDESTDAKQDAGLAPRPVTYEKVCTDYVAWNKFKHSPAATWDEVWWVGKEEMLTREELRARFKEIDEQTGKPIADLVPLRSGEKDKTDQEKKKRQQRACVYEIWDKNKKQVVFIAPDWPNGPLEITDDPLNLQTFWPCPEPLYATLTNDTLVPVPDFVEYQDQANELDDLTTRIDALTSAIRVNGVYDASYPELQRILQEGVDNRMIGVKNYAQLASKGGLKEAMSFVPIKDVVEALVRLYEARDRVKADMGEITGISDIVRGQAQGQTKTATEQRIKGQFASLRLEDRKKEVARFARDDIAISAEIISEQFSVETLAEMTGMIPFIVDELKVEAPPLVPQMGHNGGPPLEAAPGDPSSPPGNGAPGGGSPAVVGQQPSLEQLAQARFEQACALLKDDKMRTFRIDIETDSTVEMDKQQSKEAATELVTAVGGLLEKAVPLAQVQPKLVAPIGQTLLWVMRSFGAGRDVESVWNAAIDELTQASKNPPPPKPSPDEIKAQAEAQKQAAENEREQMRFAQEQQLAAEQSQRDQQKAQFDFAMKEREAQLREREMAMELEFKERELAFKERELQLNIAAKEHEATLSAQSKERDAALAERAAEREAEAGEHEFELGQRVREAQAKEAMKPKGDGE